MWIKISVAIGALVILLGFAIQPVPFRYVTVKENDTFVAATKATEGSRVLLGTSSHILPLVRAINWVVDPFKKWLVPLDTKALKQEAIDFIEHDDFGDMIDWEAFERLVQVGEEKCHFFGRFLLKEMLSKILKYNLKIQKTLKEHPEIENEVIEKPIILLSFTRTGATFLYQVLADIYQKEELKPTYSYEIFGGPFELHDPPQRVQEAKAALDGIGYVNPPMKLLHEWIAADEPEDEPGWYQYTLTGLVIPFSFPSEWHHANIYKESSQKLNFRLWETLNKIRQWEAGRKVRFLMKSPEHLFGFSQIAEAYPDATFVSVSRDDASWYPSSLVITHLYRQMFVHSQVNDTIAFADRLMCGQRHALDVAHGMENNTILPIHFGSYLFTQTLDVVEKIAQHANLSWDNETQQRAEAVITKRLSWKHEKVAYKLDDFGLSKKLVSERVVNICDNLPSLVG